MESVKQAVINHGGFGRRAFVEIDDDPWDAMPAIRKLLESEP
jgi:hypothetical protein